MEDLGKFWPKEILFMVASMFYLVMVNFWNKKPQYPLSTTKVVEYLEKSVNVQCRNDGLEYI